MYILLLLNFIQGFLILLQFIENEWIVLYKPTFDLLPEVHESDPHLLHLWIFIDNFVFLLVLDFLLVDLLHYLLEGSTFTAKGLLEASCCLYDAQLLLSKFFLGEFVSDTFCYLLLLLLRPQIGKTFESVEFFREMAVFFRIVLRMIF